ncbi:MAG: lactonase family protein [Lachnospiraceae bacterium]|nr:lactonase family protein [Lachnospiraceae bacterium]
MAKEKYVAYVSTYTMGDSHGIRVYDVDVENGRFTEKDKVEITNSSYVAISHNRKYLYSITDFGVEAYNILKDGSLELLNFVSINGMRGCYLSTDYTDQYLFVAGYHDGKLTVLRLEEDGSIGAITDEIFHKGMSSQSGRNSRPHVNCARMTHDNKYLLVADQGMDHVNVYRINLDSGKLRLADVIRGDMEAGPRHVKMSQDGRFVYIVNEWECNIDVYSYEEKGDVPYFNRIQSISTLNDYAPQGSAANALSFSADYNYLLSSNVGDNSVILYNVNKEDGTLTKNFCLPISGEFPKDADIFPNNKFVVSLNHESSTLTFFKIDVTNGWMTMNGAPMKLEAPNCIIFHKLA